MFEQSKNSWFISNHSATSIYGIRGLTCCESNYTLRDKAPRPKRYHYSYAAHIRTSFCPYPGILTWAGITAGPSGHQVIFHSHQYILLPHQMLPVKILWGRGAAEWHCTLPCREWYLSWGKWSHYGGRAAFLWSADQEGRPWRSFPWEGKDS